MYLLFHLSFCLLDKEAKKESHNWTDKDNELAHSYPYLHANLVASCLTFHATSSQIQTQIFWWTFFLPLSAFAKCDIWWHCWAKVPISMWVAWGSWGLHGGVYADAPCAWQHVWKCTQQRLGARSPMWWSGRPTGQWHGHACATATATATATSPPVHHTILIFHQPRTLSILSNLLQTQQEHWATALWQISS